MKAMIFAAGLGTRLGSYTQHTPKALVEVAGKPMLAHVVERLKQAGVTSIIINLHHFADKIKAWVAAENNFGIEIKFSDETAQLLDTGGGLLKARWFFDDGQPFVVHNVDVLSNINILAMLQQHNVSHALATLFVQKRRSTRYLLFDEAMLLRGRHDTRNNQTTFSTARQNNLHQLAFNGIHILNPAIFDHFAQSGAFSIIETYLSLARNHTIKGFRDDEAIYLDIGKPDALQEAQQLIRKIN
ncbi:MAG: nucleotidyltransferase family protein [Bacteroidales bacterium]|nr:nucleotidyltransferase family protein [Bacteroidales bacterium]MDD3131893.1 nucleotidyltransferase family protein [Bacteroidales bacterium]NLO51491.1 nucleotidyltransferase family protein [Bacteroidales bacterium]